jgi:hypothetical protein
MSNATNPLYQYAKPTREQLELYNSRYRSTAYTALYPLLKNGQPGGRSSSDEDDEDASQSESPSDDDEVSGSDAEDTVPKGKEAAQVSDEDTDSDSPSDGEDEAAAGTTATFTPTIQEPTAIARLSEKDREEKKAQRKFELDLIRRMPNGQKSRKDEWDKVNKLYPGGMERSEPVRRAVPTKSSLKSGPGSTAISTEVTTRGSQSSSTQGRQPTGSTRTSR